ncbi:MAG: thiamine pyrophosphate-dependent enzyme [Candidatus Dormibacteraeota bacterium]|nr:thiamine pyrophosphate-dependent enzyme [Candidatus Dormibacteraeota bacterium]
MRDLGAESEDLAPGVELMEGASTVLGLPDHRRREALSDLGRPLALGLFAAMARLRAFDERAVILQRQGVIGTYPTYFGEEAIQAGSVLALEDHDWLFPTYRQNSVVVLRGCPPEVPLLLWRGNPAGWHDVHRLHTAPVCVPVATNYPHAVGAAWGSRLLGEDTVALAYGGDGSTSEGDFHEACNLAAVVRAPAIFLVTNNQWAISTPLRLQTRVERIADKASAYGMPGVRVDGFDVFACHLAVREAAARARRGGGPTLVEAVGYRLGPHGTADEPSLYRDPESARRWDPWEPLGRAAAALVDAGLASTEELGELRADAAAEMRQAGDRLQGFPLPSLEDVASRVYRETPWTLRGERLREPTYLEEG